MIEINDNFQKIFSGELFLKQYYDDKLIMEHSQKNLIVNNSQTIVAGLIASLFSSYTISQIGFGDGTSTAVSGDEILQGDYTRKKSIDSENNVVFGANIAQVHWNIDYDTDIAGQTFGGGVGGVWTDGDPFIIKEFGLFSTSDDMFNRIVWTGPSLVMDERIKLEGYFAITVSTI